ncbi:hypothetical protein ONS95_014441 [Cadophora gregata]|uniref:uncharacterized protein n=1 Tax=Cadophora gregata TaxID=51156 RepID=UPI0026DD65DC|nr:uncharacterized protein ONS95_014441 [Cadophora gregata]KAK0112705.1 hypothetical protein ONS95_014441 [Cadophora gregata]KAK0124838.1 hypothetical protein ONS96_008717 [Cadophora gregata f. sp. sojae]
MRFTSLIFLIPGITAYMVPENAVDGMYTVFTAANGSEIHTLLPDGLLAERDAPISSDLVFPSSAKFRLKRQNNPGPNQITCGTTVLDVTSTNNANNNIDTQCGAGATVGKGKTFYAKFGSTVSFYCNYANGANVCYASERQLAANLINGNCGGFVAGYDHVVNRADTYGWQNMNICFCFC